MALGEGAISTGGALVPPQYGLRPVGHTHARVGGGRLTHRHAGATPGHRHEGLLPHPGRGEGKAPRDISPERRAEAVRKGWALPDGSYPVWDRDTLRRAILSFGRSSDKTRTKAHIVKRARALGLTEMLPEGWA